MNFNNMRFNKDQFDASMDIITKLDPSYGPELIEKAYESLEYMFASQHVSSIKLTTTNLQNYTEKPMTTTEYLNYYSVSDIDKHIKAITDEINKLTITQKNLNDKLNTINVISAEVEAMFGITQLVKNEHPEVIFDYEMRKGKK